MITLGCLGPSTDQFNYITKQFCDINLVNLAQTHNFICKKLKLKQYVAFST